ncbi:hypothetical protein J2W25_000854 [Variovorax boronicumulans]|uniref:Uncharacterized protein n=1 Tax=Variovorax boronicumulans TaxID=436515 RepID=A0AAW8DR39_9BURK|nr:hypothetical protein [Variovorax boronicumulans]MDP9877283.1 hypothetical protein [Variovorax boronicumulans]MDP9921839.1 hypothetical protein [Variovorax boronicumulans]
MTDQAKFYRCLSESCEGIGLYYFEVVAGMTTRAIESIGGQLWWSSPSGSKSEKHEFTDQPEFSSSDAEALADEFGLVEISASEFGNLWRDAHAD